MSLVDEFILLDSVQLTDSGNMHRNRLIDINGKIKYFTITFYKKDYLKKDYLELEVHREVKWQTTILNFIKENYKNSQYYCEIWPIVYSFFTQERKFISEYAIDSIYLIKNLLKINTKIIKQSELFEDKNQNHKSDLVLSLCVASNANEYYSGSGGSLKYLDHPSFTEKGIKISFISAILTPYHQKNSSVFVPGLSMLDIFFNLGILGTQDFFWGSAMKSYKLINLDDKHEE